MALQLTKSPVVFNEFEHTYTLGDLRLSGVTALLSRQLFADKYDDIPKAVLDKAAERGNLVHRQIEIAETLGIDPDLQEAKDYLSIKEKQGLQTIATEYLVSDNTRIASSIDLVFLKDDTIYLCDIKTTSKLDIEYLSWQLSIYKHLFLMQNALNVLGYDIKLCAIWLPKEQYGKPKYTEVHPRTAQEVQDLLTADAGGEQYYATALAPVSETLPVDPAITTAIANYLRAEQQAKLMKEQLREIMEQHGIKKWDNDDFTATIGEPTESTTLDSRRLKADNPELYNKYLKTTQRKGSFTLKLK